MRRFGFTFLWHSYAVAFFCFLGTSNHVYAQAISTSTLLLDSFKIESGNTDFTNSVTLSDKKTFVGYTLNDGASIDQNFVGWDVSLSDSETTSSASSSVSLVSDANSYTATASASINGDAEILVVRSTIFTVPVDGFYTFSIDYDLFASTDNYNSDANSSNVVAFPLAMLTYTQQNPNGTFFPAPAVCLANSMCTLVTCCN